MIFFVIYFCAQIFCDDMLIDVFIYFFKNSREMNSPVDPRRADKVIRFKPIENAGGQGAGDDLMPDYMNILGNIYDKQYNVFARNKYMQIYMYVHEMNTHKKKHENYFKCIVTIARTGMIFSMCGLMMKLKWCAWLALYCSCISFANSRASDDAKQVFTHFDTIP